MKDFFTKEVLAHPIVLSAFGAVVLIAIGSGAYYMSATRAPATLAADNTSTSTLLATGVVETAQSGELSFVSGGRVVRVPTTVGAHVSAGQVLASLDTSSLAAAQAQAAATLKSAEAHLADIMAGSRPEDVAVSQAQVSQDQVALSDAIAQAYTTADSAVHNTVDQFMTNPRVDPKITFQTDGSIENALEFQRLIAETSLSSWQSSSGDLAAARTGIAAVATLLTDASNALNRATIDSAATQTKITAYTTAVATARTALNSALSAIDAASAKLATDQSSLALKQAGATTQAIAAQQAMVDSAQASVDAASAALRNSLVIAPFSGSVASVHVKTGDVVPPGTLAVSITPAAALQISAYYSEIDVAHITVGEHADVTLDAYGSGRVFPAKVVSIDRAPTMQGNTPAYKVVLQFATADPAITIGMSANVAITN
ncbi:MAG: HlyD family efflux transporter periplasmic adaptor subunit [Patescibacteria group bacterium]